MADDFDGDGIMISMTINVTRVKAAACHARRSGVSMLVHAHVLMNAMLASGGYRWTVITVDRRNEYMAALEEASVNNSIKPFAALLAGLQS